MHGTRLYVPFKDKDAAKALGARWDAPTKHWIVPERLSVEPFRKWMPCTAPPPYPFPAEDEDPDEHPLEWLLHSPRIRFAFTSCYRCGAKCSFYFGEAYSERVVFLDNCIGLYSRPVVDLIANCGPELPLPSANLQVAFLSTTNSASVMQCCPQCGAHFGHHPLWEEVVQAFGEYEPMPTLWLPNPADVFANPNDVEHQWAP